MFNTHTRTLIVAFFGLFWTLSVSGLFAQNLWETLPVFHNGRVMPLHTFARQAVREICGTERPFLVRDDSIIADFNQVIAALEEQELRTADQEEGFGGYRFLNPGSSLDGGFDRRYSIFKIAGEVQQISTALPIQGLNRAQITRLANRIKEIVPLEGRYFYADELLLSWVCEPEVWRYIPIFLVSESEYLDEIFNTSFAGDARTSQYRVSLHQLEKSQRYKQRLAEIQRRYELGQITKNPVLFDQITERLDRQSRAFLNLTFHPQRQRPDRMVALLSQTIDEQSSYFFAFRTWGYLLELGEFPGRQATERALNPDELTFFHPTTQRWHDIADKLRFQMRIYDRTDSAGNPVLPNAAIVEQQYEILIDLIDTNVSEAAALMEALYPGVSYRSNDSGNTVSVERLLPRLMSSENQDIQTDIRQVAIGYYYSVKKLRNEVESAYLALYDNGYSLRFLPILSPPVLEMMSSHDNHGVLPWASAQMILGSGEAFIKRFLDPRASSAERPANEKVVAEQDDSIAASGESDDFGEEPLPETSAETETASSTASPIVPADPLADTPAVSEDLSSLERALFMPVEMRDGNIRLGAGDRTLIGTIRARMRELLFTYSSSAGSKYGNTDFLHRATQLQFAVIQAAANIETQRTLFVDSENRLMEEQFKKTAYPEPAPSRKLLSEYRYDRLRPFYWMGVFALLALFLNVGSYFTAATRNKSAVTKSISIHMAAQGESTETELADYTNSIEEWLFISSVAMLLLAILVALLGGLMRAGVTGWAPITNMYETVVMMALAAAILGVWYALYPLLHPALRQAWVYSRFPGIGTMLEWLEAMKAKKAVTSSLEGSGESAMRAAAQEFGVPGGMALGGGAAPITQQGFEEWETQQRAYAVQRKLAAQCLLALPRLLLTLITFYLIVSLANGEYAAEHGFFAASVNMFAVSGTLDTLTAVASVLLILWIVPHAFLALLVTPAVLSHPRWIAAELGIQSFEANITVESASQPNEHSQHGTLRRSEMSGVFHGETRDVSGNHLNTSGGAWLKQARNALLDRKLLIAVTAAVVCITALIAGLNRTEFNPDIKPIMAVLRNNFWLAVHVSAIIVSYAAAFIAWGMAVVSLGYAGLGRYLRSEPELEGEKGEVLLPGPCLIFMPIIERLLKTALLLLIVGTILGARWADFSWGRFWSWDPKEVWALITIFFLVIVLHGRIARYYGPFGITVGALFASIAVIFTWYGINFLPLFKNSVHAYGGGTESYAMLFVLLFIVANLLWGTLALLRYNVEVYGSESGE